MARSATSSLLRGQSGLRLAGPIGDHSRCAWLAIDAQRRIAGLSRDAQRLLRLNPRKTLNQPLAALPAPLARVLNQTFSTARSHGARRVKLPAADGIATTVRLTTITVRSSKGRPLAVLALLS